MLVDLDASVLPAAPQLQLDSVDVGATAITLGVSSIQVSPTCPACGHSAHRVHSRYERTLADLPWPNLAARIQLHVRRFFCEQPACPRTTFAEGVPALTRPYGRRTHRLKVAQQGMALALGGAPGARLSDKLRMPTSRNTLLRLLRQLPVPAADAPRVVGLDDWAKGKLDLLRVRLHAA